jgi:hypothetical protein
VREAVTKRMRRILAWLAARPIFRLDPRAGRGPEWAIWGAGFCAVMSGVALVSAAHDLLTGQNPKTDWVILVGSFAAMALPLYLLRLPVQAVGLLAVGLCAMPLIFSLPS